MNLSANGGANARNTKSTQTIFKWNENQQTSAVMMQEEGHRANGK